MNTCFKAYKNEQVVFYCLPASKPIKIQFCGNHTAELLCVRSLVSILRAHYGDTGHPCPSRPPAELLRDCVTNVWPLVHGRCSGKVHCSFPVSDAVFGQPCATKGNALEVIYKCTPGNIS